MRASRTPIAAPRGASSASLVGCTLQHMPADANLGFLQQLAGRQGPLQFVTPAAAWYCSTTSRWEKTENLLMIQKVPKARCDKMHSVCGHLLDPARGACGGGHMCQGTTARLAMPMQEHRAVIHTSVPPDDYCLAEVESLL